MKTTQTKAVEKWQNKQGYYPDAETLRKWKPERAQAETGKPILDALINASESEDKITQDSTKKPSQGYSALEGYALNPIGLAAFNSIHNRKAYSLYADRHANWYVIYMPVHGIHPSYGFGREANRLVRSAITGKPEGKLEYSMLEAERNRLQWLLGESDEMYCNLKAHVQRLADALKGMMDAFAHNADQTVANEGENALQSDVKRAREALSQWEGEQH